MIFEDIGVVFCIIFISSFCAFYYSFQKANIYDVPIIIEHLHFLIPGLIVRAGCLTCIWLLILKYSPIAPESKDLPFKIITAAIIGALPNFVTVISQLCISYLAKETLDNDKNNDIPITYTIKRALLKRTVKILGITEGRTWLDFLSIYTYLIARVNRKIFTLLYNAEIDESFQNKINKCFEISKRNVESKKPMQDEFIYKVKYPSKKIHIMLGWFGWKGFYKILDDPKSISSIPSWDGIERRKITNEGKIKRRFYDKKNLMVTAV